MDEFVKIDKSLARGLFNQEIRNGSDILLGRSPGGFSRTIGDLEHIFLMETLERMKGKAHFPPSTFPNIARKMQAYKLSPSEELSTIKVKNVAGSSQKSYLEISFRKRPSLQADLLSSTNCYFLLKKDRVVIARRFYPIIVTGHTIRRYLQRGEVQLGESVLAPVLGEIYERAGLIYFLANIAGRGDLTRFSVPFKDGLLLCETALLPNSDGAEICYLKPSLQETNFADAPVEHHVHPFAWGEVVGTRLGVSINTYVGPREMKEGQKDLYELVEGIYQRNKREIGLIGQLLNSFYPGHMADVEEALGKASGKLDTATKDLANALTWDRKLAYASCKDSEFDASSVTLPSKLVELAELGRSWVKELSRAAGISDRGGAPFCHSPAYGFLAENCGELTGLPHGALVTLFSVNPYTEVPETAELNTLKRIQDVVEQVVDLDKLTTFGIGLK